MNLTGQEQSASSPGNCAWMCEMDDTCLVAEYRAQDDAGGWCVMTSNKGPLYLGSPDPDADPASQVSG